MATLVAVAAGGLFTAAATWLPAQTPTAADDCQLTLTSGNVTIDAGSVCRSIDCTGYTGTLTHNAGATLTIGDATAGLGNVALRFVVGMTYTLGDAQNSAILFLSTSATVQTVDFAGKTTANVVYNAASNGSWQLTGSHNTGSIAGVNLTKGTLNVNGQTCSWGAFTSTAANTRVLTLGSSAITLTNTGTSWSTDPGGGSLTITANTATVTMIGSWSGSGTTNYNGLSVIMNGALEQMIQTAPGQTLTWANVTRTGNASKTCELTISINTSITCTSTFTCNGNSVINRVLVKTSQLGTAKTITAAVVSVTNSDFKDITGAGAGSWNLSAISGGSGDCQGNSGITFTAPVTRFWVGGAGNWDSTGEWSASSGGASGATVPLSQDTAIFDANSFAAADQVVLNMPRLAKHIDCTGVDTAAFFSSSLVNQTIFGNLTFQAGMGTWIGGANNFILEGRGAQTITSAGVTFGNSLSSIFVINTFGGSYTMQDTLTLFGNLQINNGNFNANNFSITMNQYNASATSFTRSITMGSGTWNLTGAGNIWSVNPSGLTITPNTSTILISNTSGAIKTFAGGGLTYSNLTISGGGAGAVQFTGSNTFNVFTINAPKTVEFTAGTTTTVSQFIATGSVGNIITIRSITAAQHTLSKASGIVSANWLNLTNSNATGGATWYAGANSVDNGGNSGWIFANAPTTFAGQVGQLLLLGVGQ